MMSQSKSTLPNFDTLWNYGDPGETERRFRELLPAAELSHDAEYLAQLLTQIARCEGLQGKFEMGHATLDAAEQLISKHDLRLARARYLLERGRAYNSSNQRESALPLFHQAYDVASALNESRYAVDAVHMIAIAEVEPAIQLEWNLKAIALAEATNERGWLFALYNNVGETYLSLGEYDSAYDYFSRLAALQAERTGSPDMYTVKDRAKAARLAGRMQESQTLMQPILDRLLTEGKDDGYIRQELAEALYSLGKGELAGPHYAMAFELLSVDDWVVQNEPQQLQRMQRLSK
ncbi:MAG: hypothetical protein Q8922_06440 [Bacteroidota bacterium]|nr:hypothetical protein [Bacteroidota bacterium]MDP4233797.1 hypothetical protein [Bacteroidota bacterium]MDP4242436.1 hypothetical protein [Bacteroidota bacterium]MDP4287558.1 hypothetical protein [Bacteroidota bacterium]